MFRLLKVAVLFWLFGGCMGAGQKSTEERDVLLARIDESIAGKDAVVGVSVIGPDGSDLVSIRGDERFPMQSVFKFHIALAILDQVDQGKLALDQLVEIKKEQFFPNFWAPIADENPEGGRFTVATLIQYAVSKSDNVACDALIRLMGSPKAVETYIKQKGIKDFSMVFNEEDMQSDWDNMFQNWTTPQAASHTLKLFYDNHDSILSDTNHAFIWKVMKETSTGKKRLRGQLPEETVVAHKTGWSGTHPETGIMDAVNDIGIVFLPNGQHFYISVFITQSRENLEISEKIMADITQAVYDFYTTP